MHSNPFRLAVLVWFSGWLLLVMPGHTRGVVKLPGAEANAAGSCCDPTPSCCETSSASLCSESMDCETQSPRKPTDPAKHCAICFLKAHLTDPPPVTFYTPFLGELDELSYACESSIADDQSAPEQLRGRGPPC